MGDSEFRGGQHVSVYVARAWGDVIVAPWVKTQSRMGLRYPGSWRWKRWQRRKLRYARFEGFLALKGHAAELACRRVPHTRRTNGRCWRILLQKSSIEQPKSLCCYFAFQHRHGGP
jgi:hypothetical protein